ncbi:MAG: SH3 domain-containing protein, partial [Fibrobacterota bacterium]|nr:SH3 domain-containing protein [Chitinispirillaceae bacterium]
DNQWIALLSRTPCTQFKWSAAESDVKDVAAKHLAPDEPSKATIPAKVSEQATKKEQVMSSTQQKAISEKTPVNNPVLANESSDATPESRLVNITILQRNNVCALSFELDRDAASNVKRIKDTIYLEIDKTKIALKSTMVNVPKGIPYSAIRVKEKTVKSRTFLQVAIVMDRKISDLKNGVMLKKEKTITFITGSKSSDKLTQWSSEHGVVLEQSLYNLPSYSVDLKTLEKRALSDAGASVGIKGNTFAIKEAPVAVAEEQSVVSTTPNADEPVISLAPPYKAPLIVITDNVNLRTDASGASAIVGKLPIGEKVAFVDKKGLWYNVKSGEITGWVHEKNVVDSTKITEEQQRVIVATLQQKAKAQTSPEIPVVNEIPKVVESVVSAITTEKANKLTIDPITQLEMTEQKHDSSLVDTIRNHVRYVRIGRDPFMPLIVDTSDDSKGANVEHLRLVGVLIDNADQIALLEDLKNNRKPFALRENDQVNRGKVLKIYKDKVVFLLTEFGISRSYTIRLATNQEQEAGK